MADYLVIGSGASGIHFARTALDLGRSVELVDVGFQRPQHLLPDAAFAALKNQLADPEAYFLGEEGEGVVYPAPDAKPYGFPPSKGYVFRRPRQLQFTERAFHPLLSFARGGLAEAWTGGSYEMLDEEFADFPFPGSEMRPFYDMVARRVGITASPDDMQRFSPCSAAYQSPLPLDAHSAAIHARYAARRSALNAAGFFLGRSRVAVLSRDLGDRGACTSLGRCFWGCPRGAFYTPGVTLESLLREERFAYRPGLLVRRLLLDSRGAAIGAVAVPLAGGSEVELRAERTILAAGAVASSQVYLNTMQQQGRHDLQLTGLMDNRQIMVPFVTLSRLGSDVELASYQYHMLAMGIDRGDWRTAVHGQISALKAAAVHPIVSTLPFDLATSMRVFRRMRGALGVANVWLADHRRDANAVRLERDGDGEWRAVLDYSDHARDVPAARDAAARTQRALRMLGCVAPAAMTRILPKGSSVHYAGTLPMTDSESEHSTRADGSARAYERLHVVDGAAFPWLPAKNLTFTLMANASRVAALLG